MLRSIVAALFTMALAGPAFAADKVTLMLNWYVYGEHAPFYYGKEKGYFSDAGIELEIQEGRGSGTVAQVVAAKTVQFGYIDIPTMMRAAVKGAPPTRSGRDHHERGAALSPRPPVTLHQTTLCARDHVEF